MHQKPWSYICFTVPEIWCVTDVIVIFHFGLFFPFYPPNGPKNESFKKMKKNPRDIIILPMSRPVLESKGMHTILQKKGKKRAKRGKIFENLSKNVQNLKNGKWLHAIITSNKLLEKALPVYQKSWLDDVRFLRYGTQQMDGQTDRKSDT